MGDEARDANDYFERKIEMLVSQNFALASRLSDLEAAWEERNRACMRCQAEWQYGKASPAESKDEQIARLEGELREARATIARLQSGSPGAFHYVYPI